MTLAADDIRTSRAASVIRAVDLAKWYDQRPVFRDVNLDVPPGAFLALLGANGAGKSTLLKLLATLIPISGGELRLFGQATDANAAGLRARIGLIGHQPILYRDLTILENLLFFGRLYRVGNVRVRARELLERVDLAHRADDPVRTLSRGMTQRASIARALMHDPPLLLADEPFAGLDVPSSRNLESLLRDLNRSGKTIVMANHDIAQSLELAAQVTVLHRGQVVIDRPSKGLSVDRIVEEVSRS